MSDEIYERTKVMRFLENWRAKSQPVRRPDSTLNALDGKAMFIGVGAMKTGTTWLSQYLKSHPEAYHSSLNEMNFFNTLVPNICQSMGRERRRQLINQELLKFSSTKRLRNKTRLKLYDMAEIDQFNKNETKFLEFFAARVGDCSVFGEISPSYSTLPAEGFRKISQCHPDTRMFLIMRDPTARAVSHIQHQLRSQPNLDVDARIETIAAGSIIYERSNYPSTLRSIGEGAPDSKFMTMLYEELFNENSIRTFCEFLEISYKKPRFSHRVNAARTKKLTEDQKQRIRGSLNPIYAEIRDYFGNTRPAKWLW
ncbi:MAG: sulfotransferase [Paracoccaceae bacterium]